MSIILLRFDTDRLKTNNPLIGHGLNVSGDAALNSLITFLTN